MDQPRRAHLGPTAMAIMMAASRERSLADMLVRLDGPRSRSIETQNVLAEFLKGHSGLADAFLNRAGIGREALIARLGADFPREPQPPAPTLKEGADDGARELYQMRLKEYEERQATGEPAPMSETVRAAARRANTSATKAGQDRTGLGLYLACLIDEDGNAGTAVRSLASGDLEGALAWLREQPDPEGDPLSMDAIKANMRGMLEALWPKIRSESTPRNSERILAKRDEHYEEDPSRYEAPLDVAHEFRTRSVKPEQDYAWRGGVLFHAAANEARIRKAPESKLDHLVLALLRDGTDTAAFLDRFGVDRPDWIRRLDTELPRYAEGPRWPPNGRDLNMSHATNVSYRFLPHPEGKKREELSAEERRSLMERVVDPTIRFTDLKFLRNVPDEPDTIAYRLFSEAGVTEDALKGEIEALEKGDREWWRQRPNLVEALRELKAVDPDNALEGSNLCLNAAQVEARLRGATTTEKDDLLVAILVEGTDLWSLAVWIGLHPAALREEVDALRPRGPGGVFFPSTEDVVGVGAMITKRGFSDLLFVRESPTIEEESPGLRRLRERGLTQELVDRRLAELGVETFR